MNKRNEGCILNGIDDVTPERSHFADLGNEMNVIAMQKFDESDDTVRRDTLRQATILLVAGSDHLEHLVDLIAVISARIFFYS